VLKINKKQKTGKQINKITRIN